MSHPTAIIARIPEARSVIGEWRDELDPLKALGMPAHVTVLWPFRRMADIGPDTITRLRDVTIAEPSFTVRFDRIGWFGEELVHLVPDPTAPFRRLTRAIAEEFPEHPPYEGRFDEVVPHMTVGHGGSHDRLHTAADHVLRAPAIVSDVTQLTLCERQGPAGSWRMVEELPLGPRRRGPS